MQCSTKDNHEKETSPTSIARLVLVAMNQPHSIILRAANPAFDEGLVFALYLDESAEGFFRFMLGRQATDIIATAYTQPDHDFSYQHITFAERDKVIVGMASGKGFQCSKWRL